MCFLCRSLHCHPNLLRKETFAPINSNPVMMMCEITPRNLVKGWWGGATVPPNVHAVPCWNFPKPTVVLKFRRLELQQKLTNVIHLTYWVKASAAQVDDLRVISKSHKGKEKNKSVYASGALTKTFWQMFVREHPPKHTYTTHTHTHNR